MIIGVTGRIASGKSTFCELFKFYNNNYRYVDCDKIIKEEKIYENWYNMNKADYSYKFFRDKDFRNKVNKDCGLFIIPELFYDDGNVIVESAALFVSGLHVFCDATYRITCPYERRYTRMKERGCSDEYIEHMERLQTESLEDLYAVTYEFRCDEYYKYFI